jgi:molybdate transport system ATP-binding protein
MPLSVNIKKKLPGFELDVCFESDNHISGILGASGAGKSMTLRCIAGLEKPDSGRIVMNGRVLYDSEKGIDVLIRNRKIGILFQNYALFPHMTVEQNIGFGLGDLSSVERKQKVKEKIAMLQLEGLEQRYPYQISGGQQQRVALARALVVEPEALLLDEPLSALDDHLRDQTMIQLLDSLAKYQGATLFVTHNIDEAYRMCDNLIVMSDGKVEACGNKEDIFKSPPSVAAAQITGCKNISKVKRVSQNLFVAVDWHDLPIAANIPDNVTHVGMRAHHIALASGREQRNVFDCWPTFISETPFRALIYLCASKPLSGTGGFDFQWEVNKEDLQVLDKMPQPWKIYINTDRLFYIST